MNAPARAVRDALTSLPGRALFEDRVDQALQRAARGRHRVAVAFMDLDGFKQVNDCFGHAAGDELLRRIAQRLVLATRRNDVVARFGGDEFALLLEGLDGSAAIELLRGRVHRIACAPLVLDAAFGGVPVVARPRASIGVALYPDHAVKGASLLRFADAAMYAVKRAGGGVRLCPTGA